MDIAQLTAFFGWCTVINFGLLLVAAAALTLFRASVLRIHGAILGMTEAQLMPMYVNYLAWFKVLWIVFNLVPWIALKII